jgi:hypothetical protein
MYDGSTEVSVIDCSIPISGETAKDNCKFNLERMLPKQKSLPSEWNCEDCFYDRWQMQNAKLIHFTDLKCQPWFYDHPNPELKQLWENLERETIENNP